MRNIVINTGLMIGTVLVFFALGEITLRGTGIEAGHPVPPQIYRSSENPEIGYELKPLLHASAYRSTVTTNSQGFRSPELDPAKKTIAILGDSIAFGYGLEDDQTIASRLSDLLGGKENVLNSGVPGYNLRQETATYAQKIAKLHPSTLVIIFYFNDLRDLVPGVIDARGNIVPRGSKDLEGPPVCHPIETGILSFIPGKCWLDLHSAFYRAVRKFVSAREEQHNLQQQEVAFRQDVFSDTTKPENFQSYAKTLDRLVALLPRHLPRLFVLWPEKELHFPFRPKVRALAEAHGFRVLDLYEVFGNQAETLGWDTVHPSAKTTGEAAAIIADMLKHEKLIRE
ncbi:SGNH/GDSL hydrolase family protein [Candidatus Peregrinibacteria bacterium]|nr:SGNH/GDSL hydrolase family protein [Candidatus Peregrinibacteria bacterium]